MKLRFFLIIFLVSIFLNSKSISDIKKSKWTIVGEDKVGIVSVDLGTIVKKNDIYYVDWIQNYNKPITTPNSKKAWSFWRNDKIKCGKTLGDSNQMKSSYVEYYDQRMRMDGINMINKGNIVDKFIKKDDDGKWNLFDKKNNYKSVGYFLTEKVCSQFQELSPEMKEMLEKFYKNKK